MSVFLKTDTCICTELAEADIGVSDYPLQDATQLCCYLSVVELKQCCISSTLRLLSNFFCHFPFHAPVDNQDKRLVIKLCRYLDFQHLVGPSYVDTTFSLCCIFNSCAPHAPFWTHLHDIHLESVQVITITKQAYWCHWFGWEEVPSSQCIGVCSPRKH